ncbi:MAG TPA: response regulator, partial [Chloroflexota bacterium]|nr:response regulator [Chloroflexota bacterium]
MSERTLAVPPALVPAAPPVQVPGPPPSVRSTSGGAGTGAVPGRPVLVVEDEPGLAEVLAVHLQASGYQPIIAHDGLEALYALDRVTPHAVLLDLHLPQVSGFRLIQLLKQRPDVPRVPVIVLTALSFQEAEDAVRAGADDFVT